MGSHKVGQTAAELWARGSDITFSILTGVAAVVSGLSLAMSFGKAQPGVPGRMVPAAPGQAPQVIPGTPQQPSRPIWYVVGGVISAIGVANIWSSINRASALQQIPATAANQ
jgi:hypothetical protein